MNINELNFAYKVRNALNENLDDFPASTADKLASARKIALSRKKKDSALRVLLPQRAFAGDIGGFVGKPISWLGRMGLALPLIALVAGLIGIYQFEEQRRISETAEIDAGVLSDELPLSAYLDRGFNAYLAKRGE
jgi:hypothetical protein